MQIVECEQRSEEWFKLREKRMTASSAQAIAANGKGLDTYINKLMQEFYSNAEPNNYKSKAMERGNALEDSAIFAYESETGLNVDKIGFVVSSDYVGCSPDGFAGEGMIEIKCLEDKAYFQYLLDGKIDTGYDWQMQMQMMICVREWCDYTVYNPNFKKSLVIKRVQADMKKMDKLTVGLIKGESRIKEIEKQFEGVLI